MKPYHWALFATTLRFALIGVPLLIVGPAEERLLGLACLLFFGVGSAAWLLPLFTLPIVSARTRSSRSTTLINVASVLAVHAFASEMFRSYWA